MKTILLMLAVVAGAMLVFAAEQTITVEGTLVSSACYLGPKHQTGNDMGMGVVSERKKHGRSRALQVDFKTAYPLAIGSCSSVMMLRRRRSVIGLGIGRNETAARTELFLPSRFGTSLIDFRLALVIRGQFLCGDQLREGVIGVSMNLLDFVVLLLRRGGRFRADLSNSHVLIILDVPALVHHVRSHSCLPPARRIMTPLSRLTSLCRGVRRAALGRFGGLRESWQRQSQEQQHNRAISKTEHLV